MYDHLLHCLDCNEPLYGRKDKKFCNKHCRAAYHYKLNKHKKSTFYRQVSTQLLQNYKLLKAFNRAGKATVRAEELLRSGFNPAYFTHFWRNASNQPYLFCYEYGFMPLNENGKKKFSLVKWQHYMEPASPLRQYFNR